MPTAPESLPTRRSSAAASKRVRFALNLGVPEKEFKAEGGRFGVDAVSAADDGSVLEFEERAFSGRRPGLRCRRG